MRQVSLVFAMHKPILVNRSFPYSRLATLLSAAKPMEKYFDQELTRKIFIKSAQELYIPFLDAVREVYEEAARLGLQFKIGLAMSGVFIENSIRYARDLQERLAKLIRLGILEIVALPYYHSLSSLYPDRLEEFEYQVRLHKALVQKVFGVESKVATNTHLLFSDSLCVALEKEGFKSVIAEIPSLTPAVYNHVSSPKVSIIVRDPEMSNSIYEGEYEKLGKLSLDGRRLVYVKLEKIQNPSLKRFKFILSSFLSQGVEVIPPSELASIEDPVGSVTQPDVTPTMEFEVGSLDVLLGNSMQKVFYYRLINMAPYVKQVGDKNLLIAWRLLQQTDKLAMMSSGGSPPGYVGMLNNPVEAFTVLESVVSDLEQNVAISYHKMVQARKTLAPLKVK